ncbi:uncharacterized protein LOC141630959 [Silene latifolia]|uniref:uncharacterized protein LOC141630959 n=1 Tax=Silene latifolia TaxID=37657 RepID=UPI003D76E645
MDFDNTYFLQQLSDALRNVQEMDDRWQPRRFEKVADPFKVNELPEFSGGADPEAYLEWEQKIDRMFDVNDLDYKKRCKYAILKLSKGASLWFEGLKAKRVRSGKGKIDSWESLKRKLRKSHYQSTCPNKRVVTLREAIECRDELLAEEELMGELFNQNDGEEEDELVENYEAPIYDTSLVLRTLQVKTIPTDSEQRNQLFHTKCRVNDKWRSLIIDGVSCTNVASNEMVSKLGLVTTKLPHPYILHWLDDGSSVKVSKQARVGLVMGSYVDKVLCDVIPMDSCHILLGQPWQYDRDVLHRGRSNEHELKDKGKRIVLKPMSPQAVHALGSKPKAKSHAAMLIGERYVERAIDHGEQVYLLVAKENSSANVVLQEHSPIDDLLEEFGDVFPDELLAGLPPIRGIEHQIDLIPGSSLPNKAAYRCNPEERKELQKKIDELMTRGYKDGSWRMCVDRRAVNNITIKYHFPIPKLGDMLDELHGSVIFSNIDLRSGYRQIRMREGDEWKTTSKMKHGFYEWTFMPFCLTNAPSTFMRLMNELMPYLVIIPTLSTLDIRLLGFETLKDFYEEDEDFGELFVDCKSGAKGRLAGHFGVAKTLEVLKERFLCPWMQKVVHNIVGKCVTCQVSKSTFKPGEYTPSPVPTRPWDDISMDFIVSLPRTQRGKDAIMVVVDHFSKMAHLVACHKTDDASNVADLYYREIVRLHAYKHKLSKNKKPWVFEVGDLVWVYLRKEKFPSKRKNKLMPRAEGPYKVVGRVNNNAYKVEIPGDYGVHATFNVGDLSPYLDDDGLAGLRSIPF